MAARGRPRTFDREDALRRAMEVFWERGYEGASMSELTAAMGINSPSLYAAFGCKEQLLREAVAHYNETEGSAAAKALCELSTAREAIAEVLRHNVIAFTDPEKPPGCMIVLTATTYTDESRAVPAGTDAATVAAFYNTVNHGMAIQARDGADRSKLSGIAETAVSAWDGLVGPGS